MSSTKYPEQYEMDGVYYRVKRNNKWEDVCFSDMTKEEVSRYLGDVPSDYWQRLAMILAGRLRELGKFLEGEGYKRVEGGGSPVGESDV